MCGFYGSINHSIPEFNRLKADLMHRGPDDCGEYKYENIYLFHSRLSIQDLSSNASQPFTHEHLTISYNGEIYNHLELRKLCEGFNFKTKSDTETLLAMYEKYDTKMFSFLDGMFAFSLFDKKKNKIILGRDRAGEKPLFLYKMGEKIVFSSELNTLKNNIPDLKINEQAISAYLRCGFFYNKSTPYVGVSEINPGYFYSIDLLNNKINEDRYFDILDSYKKPKLKNLDKNIKEVDQILHKSIKTRLLSSDVEVGAFLSGGIDSSLIVAIASEYKKNIKTFTVKFDGAYDETKLAKLTALKYGTNHHEIQISMNLSQDIEKILFNYGQPFTDSSAVPSYYVSKEARKYVKVILNGDGADEIYGGYRRYIPAAMDLQNKFKYLSFFKNILPQPRAKISAYNYIFRLIMMSRKVDFDYFLSSTTDIFEDSYQFEDNYIFKEINTLIQKTKNINISKLNQMMFLDFNTLLPNDLLMKMDIATMANSIEGRSPFLSKFNLDFAPQIADNHKIKGFKTKFILRELSKKYLDQEIINQPKRGFEVPLKSWVNFDLKENIYDLLNTNNYSSKFFKKDFIKLLLDDKLKVSGDKRAKMLWSLYCLEVWKTQN